MRNFYKNKKEINSSTNDAYFIYFISNDVWVYQICESIDQIFSFIFAKLAFFWKKNFFSLKKIKIKPKNLYKKTIQPKKYEQMR